MAPELRTRKSSSSLKTSTPKSKDAATVKRKAADDASPVVAKKTKAVIKEDGAAKKRAKKQIEEPIVAEDEAPISDDEQDNDQALALAGVSDSEDDANVDEKVAFKEGQDVGKAPVPTQAVEKSGKGGKGGKAEKAVVYIGRIPHGFFERQMHEYFGQFGDITRLRLSRNKKTGQSKHFAFIEFADESAAEYVVKSMNNYLLFGHLLKCRMVPSSQIHDDLFKGAGKRYKAIPSNKMEGYKLKKPLSESKWAARISKENEKRALKAEKLKALGYEFKASELKAAIAPAPAPDTAVLGDAQQEAPQAVEAAPEVEKSEAADEFGDGIESLDGDRAVKKPVKASKPNAAKAGKSIRKPGKAKKAKA